MERILYSILEQDIPNLGIQIPPASLRRFWTMISHYHGNIFNASEIGKSFGASDMTMRKYLDILTGTFMIRQLLPYFANVSKRQVKSPKIYFRDSGILHNLMNIDSYQSLQTNPKIGASWEGFALEEIIRIYKASPSNCYFWATHSGAELDLLIDVKGKLLAFEFKYCDAPTITKSMKIAIEDFSLDSLTVVYPGDKDYQLNEKIFVKNLKTITQNHTFSKKT